MAGSAFTLKRLDLLEQVLCTVLMGSLVYRLWPEDFSNLALYPILLLISEGIVVGFIIFRRRTENISIRFTDWIIAFAGTFFSLLVVPGEGTAEGASELRAIALRLSAFLLIAGLSIHLGAKLSLRRSFGLVAADRGIKAGGLYKRVRHPMYLGYMMSHVGYLIFAPVPWNFAVYGLSWVFLIARIFAEERILSLNPEYQTYMEEVPYRLIPKVF